MEQIALIIFPVKLFPLEVFNDLGRSVLDNAWKGFNASLFAIGSNSAFGRVPPECKLVIGEPKLLGATNEFVTGGIQASRGDEFFFQIAGGRAHLVRDREDERSSVDPLKTND